MLGAMMVTVDAIEVARTHLAPADFTGHRHDAIFGAILALHDRGEYATPIAVAAELGGTDPAATKRQLVRLQTDAPATVTTATHARIVAEAAHHRRIITAAGEIAECAYDSQPPPVRLLEEITSRARGDSTPLQTGWQFLYGDTSAERVLWGSDDTVAWMGGESLLICGPIAVGKTTLCAQIVAGRLGLGPAECLGHPLEPAGRGLYLACDRPDQIARAFRRIIGPDARELLEERLPFWRGPLPADVTRDPTVLVTMARQYGAEFIVIDSLKDIATKIAEDEGGLAVNRAIQAVLAAGIDVLALHHQRKGQSGGPKPKTLDDVYGSNWLTAGAGSVLLLWGTPGDASVELSHLKPPATPLGPLTVEHDHYTGRSTVAERPADPLTVLAHHPRGLSAVELAQILNGGAEPSKNQRTAVRNRLNRMVDRGLAHRDETGDVARYVAAVRDEADRADLA